MDVARDRTHAGHVRREPWLAKPHPRLATVPPIAASEERTVSFLLALEALAATLGREPGYAGLMGLSGAAFLVAASEGEPCPRRWTLPLREHFFAELGAAIGLPLADVAWNAGSSREEFDERFAARVRASLEAGLPVLAQGGYRAAGPLAWGLIVGWDDDRDRPLGRPPGQVEGEARAPLAPPQAARPGLKRRTGGPPRAGKARPSDAEPELPSPPPATMDGLPHNCLFVDAEAAAESARARRGVARREEDPFADLRAALERGAALLEDAVFSAPGAPARGRLWRSGAGAHAILLERFRTHVGGGELCPRCAAEGGSSAEAECLVGFLEDLARSREWAVRFLEAERDGLLEAGLEAPARAFDDAADAARWLAGHEGLADAGFVRASFGDPLGHRKLHDALRDGSALDAELGARLAAAAEALPRELPRRVARRRRR